MARVNPKKLGMILAALIPIMLLSAILFLRPDFTTEQLVQTITTFYEKYGYITIFLAAFIEALLLISLYLPASVAVLLGSILAAKGVLSLPLVILVGAVGVLSAYIIDYLLGKYGWYRVLAKFGLEETIEKSKKRLTSKKRIRLILLSCFHPNYGAITATAAGILSFSKKEFLFWFSVAQLFWCTFWGVLFFILGYQVLDFGAKYTNYILISVILYFTVKAIIKIKKAGNK